MLYYDGSAMKNTVLNLIKTFSLADLKKWKLLEAATQAGFSIFHLLLCTSALLINAYKNVFVCVKTLCFVLLIKRRMENLVSWSM